MKTTFQTNKFLNHELDHHDATALVLLRSRTTLAVAAILTILGLMLAFYQVVLGAVAQGESLQQARNLQSAAVWRCYRLLSPVERDNCQFRINAEVRPEASL